MIIKDEIKKAEDNKYLAIQSINKNGPKYVEREDYKNKFRLLNFIPVGMLGLIAVPFVIGGFDTLGLVFTTSVVLMGGTNYFIIRYNMLKKEFKDRYGLDDVNDLYEEEAKDYKEAVKNYGIEAKKVVHLEELDKKGVVAVNSAENDTYDAVIDMYEEYKKKKGLDVASKMHEEYMKMYADYVQTKGNTLKNNNVKTRKLKK